MKVESINEMLDGMGKDDRELIQTAADTLYVVLGIPEITAEKHYKVLRILNKVLYGESAVEVTKEK